MNNLIIFGVLFTISLSCACLETSVNPAFISLTLYNSANTGGVTISLTSLIANKIIFIIGYGWTDTTTSPWVIKTKDLLLSKYNDSNVAVVNWDKYSQDPTYYNSWCAVPEVALAVADKLQAANIPTDWIIWIGFSLGAHIGGGVGRELIKRGMPTIDTIFGLDAAGVGFDKTKSFPFIFEEYYLKSGDAARVVGLYSDRLGVGMYKQYADYDIMINDGENLSECTFLLSCAVSFKQCIFCRHVCARNTFMNAIPGNPLYTARKCPNYSMYASCTATPTLDIQAVLPANAEKGLYFLKTNCTPT